MKLKNNKIKNTGLLYEMLIQNVTSEVISNQSPKAINIIKKHFHNTELAKEYSLYKSLSESTNKSESEANLILNEVVNYYNKLDKAKISQDKYNLIRDINSNYKDFFKTRVENYSLNASIYNILESQDVNKNYDVIELVKNKVTLLEHLTKKKESDSFMDEFDKLDKLTKQIACKVAVDKFNKTYNGILNENQKKIVVAYATNSLTKEVLKENIDFIYKECSKKISTITESEAKEKLNIVLEELKEFKQNLIIDENTLSKVLMYNDLVDELKSES